MKKINLGIVAHVDAGKTTLSESLLFLSGQIRHMGRVDNKNAFLDTYAIEKERGITIFSKQATMETGQGKYTFLDTPGHVDFSAEMERTLSVLDYAILVISASDGIQGHTETLWRLLEAYELPVFIFINKLDQPGTEINLVIQQLKNAFGDHVIQFDGANKSAVLDEIAMCKEALLNTYLETGKISKDEISRAIATRHIVPCYSGSALRLQGIDSLIDGLNQYTRMPQYSNDFGGIIYKVSRDESGQRLTHIKVTGGVLKVKDLVSNNHWEDKVNQIRIYSGNKFETVAQVGAGDICVVTGLDRSKPGEGVGIEKSGEPAILESVLTYQMVLPDGVDPRMVLPKIKQIEEELPELCITWDAFLKEIQVKLMGEVQIEILTRIIKDRLDLEVNFDKGKIVYKESILNLVEGVGHFEPLRHYAEVHLLLEPGQPGSGLVISSNCSEDLLAKNWQNLVLTHLAEKKHRGVLTGSEITDLKVTLVSGRAHKSHTVGGDFREATYRAVRQGLMEAESVLLEPYYAFDLELPEKMVGRAMTDVDKMSGTCEIVKSNGDQILLRGRAPVATIRNYYSDVIAYTKGSGRLFMAFDGYGLCHNPTEVIEAFGYEAENDLEDPIDSIFCAKGAAQTIRWNEVKDKMHLERWLKSDKSLPEDQSLSSQNIKNQQTLSLEEINHIIDATTGANQGKKTVWRKRKSARETDLSSGTGTRPKDDNRMPYLLVDGYNIIFDWDDLSTLAQENLEGARVKLLELLGDYQAFVDAKIIVVFDAYKVRGRKAETEAYKNIQVVYTGEAQTADHFIEKFAHTHQNHYKITVATSDALQQLIIRGAGSDLLSARELKLVLEQAKQSVTEMIEAHKTPVDQSLEKAVSSEIKEHLKQL